MPGLIVDGFVFLFDLVIDAIKAIAGGIWDLFKGALNLIGDGISWIVDFFKGLWDGFVNVMKMLFVPESSFIDKKTTKIRNDFNAKMNIDQFTNAIESLKGAKARSIPQSRASVMVFGAPVGGDVLSPITENLDFIHMAIRAFMFIILLRFDINKVHKLIRGTDLYEGE